MKKENIVLYVATLAGKLLIITVAIAVALAFVNSVTAPIIQQLNYQKTQDAIEAVLPGGGEFMEYFTFHTTVSGAYQGENGYAVEVQPAGFGGTITMMVGVDNDGKVIGISVVNQAETAGLGAIIAATTSAGEDFRGQFVGVSSTVSVTKDGGQIDSITGATITSRAVCAGVQTALDFVAEQQRIAANQG